MTPPLPDSIPSKQCIKCGILKPITEFYENKTYSSGRSNTCKSCAKRLNSEARKKKPEIYKKIQERYRENHREELRDRSKKWVKKHPERRTKITKKYNDKNPEKKREYYDKNIEKIKAYNLDWQRKNTDKVAARAERHRARKINAPINDLTAAQWKMILEAFNYHCAYCGKKPKGRNLEQEHITPLSKGGSHTLSNIVPACRSCNSKKNTGPPLRPVQPLLLVTDQGITGLRSGNTSGLSNG